MPVSRLRLLRDATLTDADWGSNPVLSAEVFITTTQYDALNRPVQMTDPGGNIQTYTYDRGGVLKSIALNSSTYVQDLHYDAKGQRSAIWYGNGTKTSYTYDPLTFRLRRLLTTGNAGTVIYQDLHYWYDAVGNITEIQDDAEQTLFFNNSVVTPTQEFTYDALYRLIQAEGRELIGTASFGAEDNWNDAAWQTTHKGDGNALQNYTQLYTYDEVGNILQLRHVAGIGSYTRDYRIDSGSNRMEETEVGVNTYAYTYDTRGNMSGIPHLDEVKWNASNELYFIKRGSNLTSYQYSGGQRIRKYTDKGIVKEERIYLGSFEIYRKFEGSSLKVERQTVHVSDDTGRIAMLEKRTYGVDPSPASLLRYIYSNHLQSASLELDENAAIISYEEYHPYGTTSYQAMNASINAVAKRYRYTGKERDEESGLYYHGARYYVPWLGRWTSTEPLNSLWYNSQNIDYENIESREDLNNALQAKYPTLSSYYYCANNPVKYIDPDGREIRIYYGKSPKDYYVYTPGIKPKIDNPLVQSVHEAILYNMNTEIGKKVWNALSNVDVVLEIKPGVSVDNHFESSIGSKTEDGKDKVGTIFWDYNSPISVTTSYQEGEGIKDFWGGYIKGYFSPSTALFHEGGHSYIALLALLTKDPAKIEEYKASANESLGFDDQYDTKEERKNITKLEHLYIRQINAFEQSNNPDNSQFQPIRYNHSGTKIEYQSDVKVNEVYKPNEYKEWRIEFKAKGLNLNDGIK